jgi:ABC-2 type transport system ATP-binding protein
MSDLLESAHAGRGRDSVAPAAIDSRSRQPDRLLPLPTAAGSAAAPILLFERVSKWYGPVIGVNQVTLELRPGITGLVGHNGCGKTTLMSLAAGQLRCDLGRVSVSGHDAWTAQAKLHVGFCPEHDTFYEEMSGRGFVETMARLCGYGRREARRRTERVLEQVGMSGRAERRLAGYSRGMRQRIKLAHALLHDPELLLLDEPMSGIDPIGRRESIHLFHELARRGKCLLVSSHELEDLEKLTDHVAIMAAGRIAAVGTLPQIRSLLDQHPLSVRVGSDRNSELAHILWNSDDVVSLERDGAADGFIVRVRNSRAFFQRIANLVLEEGYEITHLEPLDESSHDLLGYLLGGTSNMGRGA